MKVFHVTVFYCIVLCCFPAYQSSEQLWC